MNYEDTKIGANEKRFINKMVEVLATYGWNLTSVNDGEEFEPCTTGDEAFAVCNSVDESSIRFSKDDREHGVLVILNNGDDGYYFVADYNYSVDDNFQEAMESFDEWLSADEESNSK